MTNARKLYGQTMKEVVTNAMVYKDYDSLKIFSEQNRGGTKGKLVNAVEHSARDSKNNLGLGEHPKKYDPLMKSKAKVASMT